MKLSFAWWDMQGGELGPCVDHALDVRIRDSGKFGEVENDFLEFGEVQRVPDNIHQRTW